MSLEQFGALLNALGLGIPLALSLAVVFFYREAYFRYWTLSYAFVLPPMALAPLYWSLGEPLALAVVMMTCHLLGSAFLVATGYAIADKPLPVRALRIGVGVVFVQGAVLLALGRPLEQAVMLALLINLVGHVQIGWEILRRKQDSRASTRLGLGVTSILTGLWGLGYPPMAAMGIAWAGFAVAGLLHMLIGVGMVIYLLEQTARRLEEKNLKLQELDRLKTNFLSTVSHELRTPLTAVVGAANVLEDDMLGPLSPPQKEMIGIIASHSERLTRLIGEILDYTRMTAGKMRYDRIEADLARLTAETVRGFEPAYAEKGLRLTLEIAEPSMPTRLDPDRVTQVVANLLSNALKFTPAGGAVTVSIRRESDAHVVRVADTGPGVAADQRETIFQLFHQADGSTTRDVGGAGLGLAICKSIIEGGHGGRLWLEPGAPGAAFAFRLPTEAS